MILYKSINPNYGEVTIEVPMPNPDPASAIASYRYRLRDAAQQALDLGDALLTMSQDAGPPSLDQLKELRAIEESFHVISRYRVPDLKNGAKA